MITNNIVSIVTWLPALGAILILALFRKEQSDWIKKFATAWLALDFIASLWLLGYDRAMGGMQFLEDRQWIPVIGARYQMGVDGVSVIVVEPGRVTALDARSGEERWHKSAADDVEQPLTVVADGVVYVPDGDRSVDGYDVSTGARTLHFVGSARVNALDVAGSRIYAASDDGAVYGVT